MKKVLIITYYWPPSGGAGVQRWLKFAKDLNQFGIEPIVLTVDEGNASYALIDDTLKIDIDDSIIVVRTKTNEPFKLYSKFSKKNEIPYAGFANESKPTFFQKFMRFIRGNFFIPDARIGWNKFAIAEADKLIKLHNIDLIFTSSPPHSTQLIGLALKRKFGIPWIADLRDPWTDIYYYKKFYHLPFAKKKDANIERKVLEEANSILVVSETIKQLFQLKSDKIEFDKIRVIPNGFDESDFIFNDEIKIDLNTFILTYTGTLADNYNIDILINSLKSIEVFLKGFILRFVGKVSPNQKNNILQKNFLFKVEFIPYVEHKESIRYLLESNMLLLVIPNVKDNEGILTGKIFEYLAAKKPILCIGPVNGDASKIIEECRTGCVFDYHDTKGITAFIKENFTNKNGYFKDQNDLYKKYSRRYQAEILKEIIESEIKNFNL